MSRLLDIKVGQQWRSKDKRDHGLIRVVVEAPSSQMGYVVMERAGRKSRLRPATLLGRYSLVETATDPASAPGRDGLEGS